MGTARERATRELAAEPVAPNPLLPFTAGSVDQPEAEFPRYVVGTPARVQASLLPLTPTPVLDFVMKAASGVPRRP